MPTQVVWPKPASLVWCTASYVSVPDRLTIPILPGVWMYPGMMPILHSPGLMMPGQFGPINRHLFCRTNACFTLTMSCWGIPSVIHTMWDLGLQSLHHSRCGRGGRHIDHRGVA